MEDPRRPPLEQLLKERILVLDGAMGTLMQAHGLQEADYRRGHFEDHALPLAGDHDLLCLTRPDVVAAAHRAYLEAGADVIETNSFTATSIAQADYGMQEQVYAMNVAAARVARAEADAYTRADPSRPRYVAGSLGPTNRTASMSAEVEDPGARAVRFEELVAAYREQARGLLDGGADLLLIETVFDTLNCKAALFGIDEEFEARGARAPVVVSGTITDASGRTLTGQTVEAFWTSIQHFPLLAAGFNCALGPRELRPHLESLSALAEVPVSCYPNAGLPNELGGYDLDAAAMAEQVRGFAQDGLVNLVGGCCGTTPEHVRAIAAAVAGLPPRVPPAPRGLPAFSGLERFEVRPDSNFVNIGERTNVTGSRRFARLVLDGDYEEALSVARQQVENGAQLIDVCMDEGMLESAVAMRRFLDLLVAEPDIYRVPVMVDSSKWQVIEEGLRALPGRSVVNSLSLKEGEEAFRKVARLARRYGAAVVVMAFDEEGQAVDVARRVAIVERAHGILADEGFRDEDMVFDLNVLAIGTGIAEHDDYARGFLEALRVLKERFPRCSFSGGISNLSFSFRGADRVREALHAVFLFHAVRAGLTMGIVNAGQLAVYDDLPADLRALCEDLVLNRRPGAGEDLVAWAEAHAGTAGEDAAAEQAAWRSQDVDERLAHALVSGDPSFLEEDLPEALARHVVPLKVIEGPLMAGMEEVGDRFGSGRMFLPQVVKSARVMKKAVAWLEPHLKATRSAGVSSRGKVLLATVKGDVHDIGKNIVGVILACNGYQVDDLGVMVPCDKVLREAQERGSDIIGLSGLITPSLDEMVHVAAEMQRTGVTLPLLIGGATTSPAHTALKIAPKRPDRPVVYVSDASRAVGVVGELLGAGREDYAVEVRRRQEELVARRAHRAAGAALLPLAEARARAQQLRSGVAPPPKRIGVQELRDYPLADLVSRIDWTPFFAAWELHGRYPAILDDAVVGAQARELHRDAEAMLQRIVDEGLLQAHAAFGIWPAHAEGDDLVLDVDGRLLRLPMLRQQRDAGAGRPNRSLADFVAPAGGGDHVGAFAVTAGHGVSELAASFRDAHDDYHAILVQALGDRLAEAFAERLHERVRREFWGYAADEQLDNEALVRESYVGIRPAPGYPACPNHDLKDDLFALLDAERRCGMALTESRAMTPASSVCGLYLAHPEAHYFGIGHIGRDQLEDYARRRGITLDEAERLLRPQLADEPAAPAAR